MESKQKNKTGTKQPILQSIVVKAPSRRPWDVGDWRSALRSADYGNARMLYDLYEDMLIDGVLSDAVDKRRDAVLNSPLVFVDAKGREVDLVSDLMDSEDWEDLITTILDARFYGRSGFELLMDSDGLRVETISPKHINLRGKKIILDLASPDKGISYEGESSLVVLGKDRDHGLLLKAMPYAIYKRGGFGDWSQWIELFGMPQRIGKYNTYDPESKRLLERAMEEMGSAPYFVIPEGTTIDIRDTNQGSGTSFNEFRQACNEEILVSIIGQTLTTLSGERGARSLGEVHKGVEESKNKRDMRFTQRSLNTRVLPFLEARGVRGIQGGRFLFPEDVESISVSDVVQLSSILPIPSYYLYDKYGIPAPDGDEEVAGAKAKSRELEAETPLESKKDKVENSDPFLPAPRMEAVAVEPQMSWWQKLTSSITALIKARDKGYSIDLSKLIQEAIDQVYRGELELSPSLFKIQNDALQQAIDVAMDEPEFGRKNGAFIEQFRYNTAVFAAFKAHGETRAFVELLIKPDGSLRSFREFKKLALRISPKWNEKWLRTEYNTAVRAARAAVKYRDALRTKHLYPNLKYLMSTAKDKREDHLAFVGTVLPIEDPWWDDHLPPSEWECKCGVEVTDEPVTKRPMDTGIKPTFRNNAGKTAQFVKLSEHPYLKNQGHATCPECRRMGLTENIGNIDEDSQLCPMHRMAREERRRKSKEALLKWRETLPKKVGIDIPTQLPYLPSLHISRASIKSTLSKYHSESWKRNNALINMEDTLKNATYAGWAPDEILPNGAKKHPQVDYWLYYKIDCGYINVKRMDDGKLAYYCIEEEENPAMRRGAPNH